MARARTWILSVLVTVVLGAPLAPAAHADDAGLPQAPSAVTAVTTPAGIRVTWQPSPTANPAITHYVVHAGPDSCPITVPATATSAVMPVIKGPTTVVPRVQAVSDYGFSPDAAAPAVRVPSTATPGFRNVQLLQFSDLHGAIEPNRQSIGAPVLASAFARDRRTVKSTFTVASGDSIGGAPVISSQFEERPTIEALNLMRLDVSGLGNHEHDRPLQHLRSMVDASRFPWVESGYRTLAPLAGAKNRVLPYRVLDRGGVKVGFIGLNTADLAVRTAPANLRFGSGQSIAIDDSAQRITRSVDAARAAGAQFIVGLVHRGWDANEGGQARGPLIDTVRRLDGIDVVYGGDSHLQYGSVLGSTLVAQVPNAGQMYSRAVVCLDTKRGRVAGARLDFVLKRDVADIAPDPTVAAMVSRYKAELVARLDVPVGSVSDVFPRGGNPAIERSQESALGDLVADALRTRYGTDIAIITGGGIRDSLPASGYTPQDTSLRRPGTAPTGPYDVTLGDVISAFPFPDEVATTTITGAALWKALENGVSKWPTEGRFPQVSGMRFGFDPDRPVGSRITFVTRADGTPIPADGTTYTVVTSSFMIAGGDGYAGLFSPELIMRDPLVDVLLDAIRADAKAGRVTQVPATGSRIVRG